MKKITLLLALFLVLFSWNINAQITTYPYFEDFESDDGGWTVDIPGLWELGTPANTIINSADTGTNAWVTNLTGDYATNEGSSVVSPVFDLSSLSAPSIEFSIWWDAEFSFDGMVLQSSVDDGASWQNVGDFGDPNNWFNDDGIGGAPGGQAVGWTGSGADGFGDGSAGWVVARHALIGLAGQSNVLLRFGFGSDGSVQDEGVGFDSINVFEVSCPEPFGVTLVNLTSTSADISWTGGPETSWEFINQLAGGPTPIDTDSGTSIAVNPYQVIGLLEGSDYEFYIRADCGADGISSWVGPFEYRISGPGEVCESSILVTMPLPYITSDDTSNYGDDYAGAPGTDCGSNNGYLNGDDVIYAYTSTTDTSIDIELSNLSDNYAGVFVYTDCVNIGNQCETGGVNGFSTDDILIDNFSVIGGQTYYIVISTWAAPQSVGYTLTITENTCVDPEATYSIVSNCVVGPEFFVDVDLTDLGSATSITISDNQGSVPQTLGVAGIITFGPFANNVPVIITVANDGDANCELSSGVLTQELCLDTVVDCTAGQVAGFFCYDNNDSVILTYTSSDGTPLNLTINSGEIEGDPFDFLLVTDGDGTVLYNDEGNDGDISGLTFQSITDTITIQILSDGSVSCASGAFPDGVNFTVSCATCINPAATYQVVDDCANGDQFLIDVNIASLGDATSLTISNNIDATEVSVPATGVYQIGPFLFGVDVVVTVSSDDDVNCVINSPAIQLLACPPDNDNPCNATVALVNTDDSCTLITSGTLLEATPSGVPNGSCVGNTNDDVWYEFTALSNIQIISILNINGGGFFQDIDHALYEGTCTAPVELYCSDAEASVTPVLTIGNTYYVRIFSNDSDPVDYTFDLCIRPGSGNVLVDQTTHTVEQLVVDVLIDSECAQISNITYSTGTNFGEENGIGYFSNPDGGFPFEEGLLLTSGDASQAAGPNTNFVSSGTGGWPGDDDLTAIAGDVTNNATIIEFDFVPLDDELSFDFLMASEEYDMGGFECQFSDAFAFLLTDSNGVTTNLAVVPGTTDPILVTNIHPDNGSCPAVNEQYFGEYIPDNLPPISFDGRTDVFTAFSTVNIGESYHIKLVIADARDNAWDSGVFLKAGSFNIGEVDLGSDITIAGGTAVCEDEPIVLNTSAPNVDHVWYKDGFAIAGEIASTLIVTEPGLYTVQIIFSPSCIIDDEVLIEFLPNPVVANTPNDLTACSTTNQALFNLNENDTVVLGAQSPTDFTVTYHDSQVNADFSSNSLVSPYTNASNPQTIFVRIEDNTTGCYETTSFNLVISSPTHTAESAHMIGCDNDDDGIASFDLVANDSNVLNGQDASQFIITYHISETNAMAGIGTLASPYDSSGETIFVRVETIAFADCYVTNSFDLIIGTEPLTSFTTNFDYEVCPNASVPIIIEATPVNYAEGEVTISWYLDNGLVSNENGLTLPVIDAGDYEIEVVFNDTGCSNSTFITVIELPTCVIPQGISPNNDGLNETFDLSSYGVTKLSIFNRNGVIVYTKKNYTNEWFGQSKDGEELPVGTYFYTMEYDNGKQRAAWVYIQREN